MSPDWAEELEAVPYARSEAPQTLNLYAYVANNPLNRVDVTGHFLTSSVGTCAGNGRTGESSAGCGPEQSSAFVSQAIANNNATSQIKLSHEYRTRDKAAIAALDYIYGTARAQGTEYAGRVVKLPDGQFAFTNATTEHELRESDPDDGMGMGKRIAVNTQNAASYHTHPFTEGFSGVDGHFIWRDPSHVGYLETPSTSIYRWDLNGATGPYDETHRQVPIRDRRPQ